MKLFDFFKKKKGRFLEESVEPSAECPEKSMERAAELTPEAIVKMAMEKEPVSIYEEDGVTLVPTVTEAVGSILPGYNPQRKATNNLVEKDPKITKANLQRADADTLLLFFKFLTVKASEEENNAIIGVMQTCTLALLHQKLSQQ